MHAWKHGGGFFMHLCFTSIHQRTWTDTVLQSIHLKLLSTTIPPDRPISNFPLRCKCHGALNGSLTKWKTMTKDRVRDFCDGWCNIKPRDKGYLQPTFGSTPQLNLITTILSDKWKLIETETFVIIRKSSLSFDSNSRLKENSLVEQFWLLAFIHPHRPNDFPPTHEAAKMLDHSSPDSKGAWTGAVRCGQQWRPCEPQLTDKLCSVAKVSELC